MLTLLEMGMTICKKDSIANSTIHNIIVKHRDTSLLENKCRRDRKLFSEQDEQMMRMINKDPKTATVAMNKKLTAIGVHSLRSTITRTDNRGVLKARRHQKMSFKKKKNTT